MVTLYTNRKEYGNDIAEIIRAFWGFVEICPGEYAFAPGNAVEILLDGNLAQARGKKGSADFSASYSIAKKEESALLRKRQEKRAVKTAAYNVMRMLEPDISLPWGALTGIRPTKLLRELIDMEGEREALRLFCGDFDVKPEKAALAKHIVEVQRPILERVAKNAIDVYIGVPFCVSRCLYCSFASEVVGKNGVPNEYLDALHNDIKMGADIAREGGYHVRAMYVGGGTPTVLSADELERLLCCALESYGGAGEEFTVEAGRPDTIDLKKLNVLARMGVNRISLNPQSMQAHTLERIGRGHTPEQIASAYKMVRDIGCLRVNMDVIAGLPGETLLDMEDTLNKLAAFAPENITVHTLAVKRSSRLKEQLGTYPLPTADETERMVALGASTAKALQMRPYYMYRQKYMRGNLENVGYARPGTECVYNIDMMEEAVSIMAHGAGAMTKRVFHGRNLRVERVPAPKDIGAYISKLAVLDARKRELFL